MPAKERRNALIVRLYNEGKSNQEILTALKRAGYKDLKDTHSLSGVIARLKRRGEIPRERPQQELTEIEKEGMRTVEQMLGVKISAGETGQRVIKSSSQQRDKSPKRQKYKRITFYMEPEMIKQIKLLAIKRDIDISELGRQVFFEYLRQQNNL